jgi:exosortase
MKVDSMGAAPAVEAAPAQPSRNLWADLRGLPQHREFLAVLGGLAALLFLFWPLVKLLGGYWLDFDGYYAHGLLMPLASAFIIWSRWPKIGTIPVKGSMWALIALLPCLYVTTIATRTEMPFLLSAVFVATLLSTVWFVAGPRWLWALSGPILFLALGLPIFDRVIDSATFKLQLISTDTAEAMLKAAGLNVLRVDPTVLNLDNFDLNIAEACSGLKTTIAVSASVIFFMMITPMRWWAAAILAVIAIPLSIVVNGLRIALIGLVGNSQGAEAGMKFHDYSGYIALAVCFLVLAKLTKLLEAKK